MKKICIVTVYNSVNSGSYWQAFVLGRFLEEHGYEVNYLERKGNGNSSNRIRNMLIHMIHTGIRYGPGHGARIWKQFFEFKKREKDFSLWWGDDYSRFDCFILGSDTIWNLESRYFANNRGRYWGSDFAGCRTISYAASAANTEMETVRKYPELYEAVNRLSAISVRDIHTREILSEMTAKTIDIVCDPTLLWNRKDYGKYAGDRPERNYIFLYLFQPLNRSQMDGLKRFAGEQNLLIINGAGVNDGCDRWIVNTPLEFLRYLYYADYVVTDTFHGTIFSINIEKRFAVIGRGKKKVDEFLADVGLVERLTDGDELSVILTQNIDYGKVRAILKRRQEFSRTFLLHAVGMEKQASREETRIQLLEEM